MPPFHLEIYVAFLRNIVIIVFFSLFSVAPESAGPVFLLPFSVRLNNRKLFFFFWYIFMFSSKNFSPHSPITPKTKPKTPKPHIPKNTPPKKPITKNQTPLPKIFPGEGSFSSPLLKEYSLDFFLSSPRYCSRFQEEKSPPRRRRMTHPSFPLLTGRAGPFLISFLFVIVFPLFLMAATCPSPTGLRSVDVTLYPFFPSFFLRLSNSSPPRGGEGVLS